MGCRGVGGDTAHHRHRRKHERQKRGRGRDAVALWFFIMDEATCLAFASWVPRTGLHAPSARLCGKARKLELVASTSLYFVVPRRPRTR